MLDKSNGLQENHLDSLMETMHKELEDELREPPEYSPLSPWVILAIVFPTVLIAFLFVLWEKGYIPPYPHSGLKYPHKNIIVIDKERMEVSAILIGRCTSEISDTSSVRLICWTSSTSAEYIDISVNDPVVITSDENGNGGNFKVSYKTKHGIGLNTWKPVLLK